MLTVSLLVVSLAFVGASSAQVAETDEVGTEVWNVSVDDDIHSSPTIVDGTAYVGSHDGNVYAFDADDGTLEWQFETGDIVDSSPAVVDGTVYIGSQDSRIYAIDTDDGTEVWNVTTWGTVRSSPTVVDGTVYVGTYDNATRNNHANVYALDAETGEEEWSFVGEASVWSSPAVAEGLVFFGDLDDTYESNFVALHQDNGTIAWTVTVDGEVQSSPTVVDGTVYVGSSVRIAGEESYLNALDAETGAERWSFETDDLVSSSPTVVDDVVYVGSHDRSLYAIRTDDGGEVWNYTIDRVNTGEFRSSPTVADDTVFAGNYDGNLYALDVEDGSKRWSFETGREIRSSPTVVDGTAYVGSRDNRLYAIHVGAGTSLDSRVLSGTLGHHDLGSGDDPEVDLDLIDAQVSDTEIEAGGSVTITTTIANDGDATGEYTAELEIDGDVEATDTVSVDGDSTTEVTFTHTFDETGEFDVHVDGLEAGTVTVTADEESSQSPTPSLPSGSISGPSSLPPLDPVSDPVVSVDALESGAAVTVTDAVAHEPTAISLEDDVGADDTSLTQLAVTPATDTDFDVTVETGDDLSDDVDELPNDAALLQALEVESSLESDEIENATLEFVVTTDELEERGLEPEDVTLYHDVDEEWVERETEIAAYPGDMWEEAGADDPEALFPGDHWAEAETAEDLFPGDHWEEAGVDDPDALFPEERIEAAETAEDLFPGDHWAEAETAEDLFPGDHWEESGVDDPEALFPGDTWEEAETAEDLFPGDTWEEAYPGDMWDTVTYEAETPHFSAFALAADRPDLEVDAPSISPTEPSAGEELTIETTVTNDRSTPGEIDLPLEIDGTVVETKTVSLEPGEQRLVTFTHTFDEPGAFDVRVGDLEAGTVVVDAETDEGGTAGDEAEEGGVDEGGTDGVPGFGVLVTVTVLLAVATLFAVVTRSTSLRS